MGFLRTFGARCSGKIARRYCQSVKLVVGGGVPNQTTSPALIQGIHVFHCQDNVGIVAKISECIASRGGNILNADIFVPENQNVFYARSEFVFDPAKWPRAQMNEDFSKISKMFSTMRSVIRVPSLDPKYDIAVFASKQDHCLVDLLHGWQDKKLPVNITAVLSNHERGPDTHVIRFLERHGIPYHHLDATKKDKGEGDILSIVKDTDFLVLARYMQVLSGNFLRSYGKDVINIHHGLLPSFKGGNPSKQVKLSFYLFIFHGSSYFKDSFRTCRLNTTSDLYNEPLRRPLMLAFDAGVKLIGATCHFVTEELDEGPIIEQMVERVSHRDNLRSFVQKSENLEKQCLANAIRSYCELRVLPYGKTKTVVF